MSPLVASSMMPQNYRPKNAVIQESDALRNMGAGGTDGTYYKNGKEWYRHQVLKQETFSLVALESFRLDDWVGFTQQQDYIKINFWLAGRHTTVLDGFGEYAHTRPEVYMTSGPWDMIKVDVLGRNSTVADIALCLLADFFPKQMGLDVNELPNPLRDMLAPKETPYGFYRMPLTPGLVAASRAILSAPFAVRSMPVYSQAKAIELMCLLIDVLTDRAHDSAGERHLGRLRDARQVIMVRYSENLTIEKLAREVCLNRMALTSGFRRVFGTSVFDFLQKVRMERAYDLLRDPSVSISQAAEAVGYDYPCNFSTAFHAYFGCTPQESRSRKL